MKRRSAIRNLVIAGAASLLTRWLRADPPDFVIHSDVRLVLLDVSVKDRKGALVAGLTKENFGVYEDGVLQPITVFANEDLPVTVGILVDESRSMTPKRAEVISAAESFIAASNPQDEIFVLNFNDTVRRGLPAGTLFSDDLRKLRAALNRGVPEGQTALNDAVFAGLAQLEAGKRAKKSLVLISDGGDNASRHSRKEMIEKLNRSLATVYTIGIYDKDDDDRDPGILKQIAAVSGGQASFPEGVSAMSATCRGIAKDIRSRYAVGFVPQSRSGNSLRQIRVRVTAPSHGALTARARTRYRYEESSNQ
jgi:VWFA-related protein